MAHWEMQEAREKLDEVVEKAYEDIPQRICVEGKEVAVVVSIEHYRELIGEAESFVAFMRRSPLYGCEDIEFGHDRNLPVDISR